MVTQAKIIDCLKAFENAEIHKMNKGKYKDRFLLSFRVRGNEFFGRSFNVRILPKKLFNKTFVKMFNIKSGYIYDIYKLKEEM